MCFLILTFSRTALVLWALSVAYYFASKVKMDFAKRLIYSTVIMASFVFALYALTQNPEFQFVIDERLSKEEITSFNNRAPVWDYGMDLLLSGFVPLTGIGFNMTPSVLADYVLVSPDGTQQSFLSFHSIILEFFIGFGILAVPIFGVLGWRMFVTWRSNCLFSFFIYLLFFLSQSLDYTFYRPKEVIIWAVILGLAEGNWRSASKTARLKRATRLAKLRESRSSAEIALTPT
jgi:hypothetical protein